jgi:DNA-binding transcriptional MerR regulator
MSKYPKDTRPPEATCPEGLEDLVEWERSRADYHEAWREKLEARNKTLKARVEELEARIKELEEENQHNWNGMKIKKWLKTGHGNYDLDSVPDTDTLLERAVSSLDRAYAHDITGEVLFEGEDGKFYGGCVEFVISEANPDYVDEVLGNDE